jgi:DNA-binding transcriptional ArsR family regulator
MQKRGPGPSDQDLEPLVGLFRLLSDKTRLNILMLLAKGERNVSSLCEELGLPQPTVSHHLGLLRMSNLIANRRDGKQVFYELNGRVDAADGKSLAVSVEKFHVKIGSTE